MMPTAAVMATITSQRITASRRASTIGMGKSQYERSRDKKLQAKTTSDA